MADTLAKTLPNFAKGIERIPKAVREELINTPVDDILRQFASGAISQGTKDRLLQDKYLARRYQLASEAGIAESVMDNSMEELTRLFDSYKNRILDFEVARKRDPQGMATTEFQAMITAGRLYMDSMQGAFFWLNGPLTALGDKAEVALYNATGNSTIASAIGTAIRFGDVVQAFTQAGLAKAGIKLGAKIAGKVGAAGEAKVAEGAQKITDLVAGAQDVDIAAMRIALKDMGIQASPEQITEILKRAPKQTQVERQLDKLVAKAEARIDPRTGKKFVDAAPTPDFIEVRPGEFSEMAEGKIAVGLADGRVFVDPKNRTHAMLVNDLQDRGIIKELDEVATSGISKEGKVVPTTAESIDQRQIRMFQAESGEAAKAKLAAKKEADMVRLRKAQAENIVMRRITPEDSISELVAKYKSNLAIQSRKDSVAMEYFRQPTSFTLEEMASIVPGTPMNSEQITALIDTFSPVIVENVKMARLYLKNGDPELKRAVLDNVNIITRAMHGVMGTTSEAGRALQVLGDPTDFGGQLVTELNKVFAKLVPELADTPQAQATGEDAFIKMFAELDPNAALTGLLHRLRPGGWDKFKEIWRNLLLAKPITPIRNVAGPLTFGVAHTFERAAAGMLPSSGVGAREAFDFYVGMQRSFHKALDSAAAVFKEQKMPLATTAEFEHFGLDRPVVALGGRLGEVVRLPQRVTSASDEVFTNIFMDGDLYARFAQQMRKEGITTGTPAWEREMARRMATASPEDMHDSMELARTLTLTKPLDGVAKKLQVLLQEKAGFIYTPFFRTFMNSLEQSFARTPGISLVSPRNIKDIIAGGRAESMATVRLFESMLLGDWFFTMAQSGLVNGGGPADPKLNAQWRADGNMPYSIRLPDGTQIPYLQFIPYSIPLAIVADAANGFDANVPSAEMDQIYASVFNVMSRLDSTVLENTRSLVGLSRTVTMRSPKEFDRILEELVFAPVETAATGGPLGAAVLDAIGRIRNPEVAGQLRESHGVLSSIAGRWSPEFNSAIFDEFGQPKRRHEPEGPSIVRELVPMFFKPRAKNPSREALKRLNLTLDGVPRDIGTPANDDPRRAQNPETITGLRLNRDEWEARNEIFATVTLGERTGQEQDPLFAGLTFEEAVLVVDQNPLWDTPAAKRQQIKELRQTYLELADINLMAKFPSLMQRQTAAEATADLQFIADPNERAQHQQQIRETMDQMDVRGALQNSQMPQNHPAVSGEY